MFTRHSWIIVAILQCILSCAYAETPTGFGKAHELLAHYWQTQHLANGQHLPLSDTSSNMLAQEIRGSLTTAISETLNEDPRGRLERLKQKLEQTLTPPTITVGVVQDSVAVLENNRDGHVFVAYDVDTCASCSHNWLGEFAPDKGRYSLIAQGIDLMRDSMVHIDQIQGSSHIYLLLYGANWGDPHRRVSIRVLAEDGTLRTIWSATGLIQGEVTRRKNGFTVAHWNGITPSEGQTLDEYQVIGGHIAKVGSRRDTVR